MYNDDSIQESLKWLKEREGFKSKPYADYKQESIGYGTGNTGLSAITPEKAEGLLQNEVINRRAQLGEDYPQGISNWGKLALDDRLYNAGVEAVRKSKFLQALKGLDEDEAQRQLADWNKVTIGGKKVEHPGLTDRVTDLAARRGLASNEQTYNVEDSNTGGSTVAKFPKTKGYVDDGFRMAGVEGGEQPSQYSNKIDLNEIFSNYSPELGVLPKVDVGSLPQPVTNPDDEYLSEAEVIDQQPTTVEPDDVSIDNSKRGMTKSEVSSRVRSAPDAEPKKEIHPLQRLLEEYQLQKARAEEEAKNQQFIATMLKAAGQFTGAMTRGKADTSAAEAMYQNAGRLPSSVDKELEAKLGVHKLISQEKQNELDNKVKQEYYKQLAEQAKQTSSDRLEAKKEKQEQKIKEQEIKDMEYLAKFGSAADNARSQTPLGNAGMTVRRSDVLKTLATRTGGKVTSTEVKELAAVTDALLRGGNTAVGTLKMLLPSDFEQKRQSLLEWITSDPYAVDRKQFMTRLINIADSEQAVADAKIKENLFSQLAPKFGNKEMLSKPEVALYLKEKGVYDELKDFSEGKQRETKFRDKAIEEVKQAHDKAVGTTPKKSDMIRVKIGGVSGSIPRANLEKAKAKYNDLEVLE